jgi:hypothetical protein
MTFIMTECLGNYDVTNGVIIDLINDIMSRNDDVINDVISRKLRREVNKAKGAH